MDLDLGWDTSSNPVIPDRDAGVIGASSLQAGRLFLPVSALPMAKPMDLQDLIGILITGARVERLHDEGAARDTSARAAGPGPAGRRCRSRSGLRACGGGRRRASRLVGGVERRPDARQVDRRRGAPVPGQLLQPLDSGGSHFRVSGRRLRYAPTPMAPRLVRFTKGRQPGGVAGDRRSGGARHRRRMKANWGRRTAVASASGR